MKPVKPSPVSKIAQDLRIRAELDQVAQATLPMGVALAQQAFALSGAHAGVLGLAPGTAGRLALEFAHLTAMNVFSRKLLAALKESNPALADIAIRLDQQLEAAMRLNAPQVGHLEPSPPPEGGPEVCAP